MRYADRMRIVQTVSLRSFFLSAVFPLAVPGLAGTVEAAESQPAGRPNIVLMMADDLGVETLGCYGGLSYPTPNIDRLAASGLLFRHAYSQPLCTNTRVELMTGRQAHRDWIAFGLLNPKSTTFGTVFQDAGYRTGMFGKWQLTSYDPPDYPGAADRRGRGTLPGEAGFDAYLVFHAGETEAKGHRYGDPTLTGGTPGAATTKTFPGKYGPAAIADYSAKFIREVADADSEQPWLLYMPLILPHWPMEPSFDHPDFQDPTRRHQADVRYFPSMVAALDKTVGHIVATLDQTGQRDNTLVLFYSDNGTHLDVASLTEDGWRQGGKGLMTDAGTHVPLIASWPGRITPGETESLVGPVDFFPTIAEVAGIPVPAAVRDGWDGVSFAPVLRGESESVRETLVIDFDPRPGWDKDRFMHQRWVRDRRWKLYDDGRLYDLERDPYESRPVFSQSSPTGRMESNARPDIRSRLEQAFR